MEVILIDHTKLSNAVEGGRVCYQSYHKGGNYEKATDDITEADKEFLHRLVHKHGHTSIARHVKYVFKVDGISTKTLLGLSRHQIGVDLSVMSSRFCKLDKFGSDFTKTKNEHVNNLLAKHIGEIIQLAEEYKPSAEDLAMLYPQASQYNLRMTMNPQSLQHFLDMRYGKESHAHFDIQELAERLLNAVPDTHKLLFKQSM
jgi:flavin-dependent thymidylate synthase